MKAVSLAGGLGPRRAEETAPRAKPMVPTGGRPILWHMMQIHAPAGVNAFVICLGYTGIQIEEYFVNDRPHAADIMEDLDLHRPRSEPWRITPIDTGEDAICMTYGNGVADIDVNAEIAFHRTHGGLATAAAARAFDHDGFRRPTDTPRDRHSLARLWRSGAAPWKVWP